ncbi:MAG: HAD family hydrolase, partial [bacterium]
MPAELQAILFDMDGLLVDTEPHFYEAHRSVFAEHGVEIPIEEYARVWIIRGARTQDEAMRRGLRADPEAV